MAGELKSDKGWQVQIKNTFLTIDDIAAGDEAPRRASSCPPAREATEREVHRADAEPALVRLEAQDDKCLNDSQRPEVAGETLLTIKDSQEGDCQTDLTFGHFPNSVTPDVVPTMFGAVPFGVYGVISAPLSCHQDGFKQAGGEEAHEGCMEHGRANAVIVKNLPSRVGEQEMLLAIADMGFYGVLAGFNIPMRYDHQGRLLNKGFAFVRFSDQLACQRFCQVASGYQFKDRRSKKALVAYVAA